MLVFLPHSPIPHHICATHWRLMLHCRVSVLDSVSHHSVKFFYFLRPLSSSVFCEKEAFKRQLKWIRAAAGLAKKEASHQLPTETLALPQFSSGIAGLEEFGTKKTFQFYLSLGWVRVIIQTAQGAPANRKTNETHFNCRSRVPQRNTFTKVRIMQPPPSWPFAIFLVYLYIR